MRVFISVRIAVIDVASRTDASLCGVMSKASDDTFPSPSDVHFHTIGADVSAISIELFGDILKVSKVGFPFDCIICCWGRMLWGF